MVEPATVGPPQAEPNAPPDLRPGPTAPPTTLLEQPDTAHTLSAPGAQDTQTAPETDLWVAMRPELMLANNPHPNVAKEIAWFKRNQRYLDRVSERSQRYLFFIAQETRARGMPMDVALLPIVESAFQPFAYSRSGAAGLWQFIPATGRRYGLKQNWWYDGRRDVLSATRGALSYLQKLHDDFDGDWLLAIAAYNAGEGTVKRAIRKNRKQGKPTDFWSLRLPRETRAYVPRLLAVSSVVKDPERWGLRIEPVPNRPHFAVVDTGGQIDLAVAAQYAEVSVREMYHLNPGFNRWATDPDGPYHLLVPHSIAESFATQIASLSAEQRVHWNRHVIKQGETLGGIARKHHTTVATLQRSNNLNGTLIRAGRSLIVPTSARPLEEYAFSGNQRAVASAPAGAVKTTYVVRKGDTLWDIALRQGTSVKKLTAWNGISRKSVLRPGQKLTVWSKQAVARSTGAPSGAEVTGQTSQRVTYTVRRGDSLWAISRRYGVSVGALRRWNDLPKNTLIKPGQELRIYVDVLKQTRRVSSLPELA
jgi:membrane-bound lytic murein transglycosylase D